MPSRQTYASYKDGLITLRTHLLNLGNSSHGCTLIAAGALSCYLCKRTIIKEFQHVYEYMLFETEMEWVATRIEHLTPPRSMWLSNDTERWRRISTVYGLSIPSALEITFSRSELQVFVSLTVLDSPWHLFIGHHASFLLSSPRRDWPLIHGASTSADRLTRWRRSNYTYHFGRRRRYFYDVFFHQILEDPTTLCRFLASAFTKPM